jgi:isopentenyl diphosphate isomerase/L-lactate dehydrogenase-like FMN-dependent dehydrogenase
MASGKAICVRAGVPFRNAAAKAETETAIKRGVSNYGGLLSPGMTSPMEMLPSIADAVAGRGSDIFKAIAFGAAAVMIGRPIGW